MPTELKISRELILSIAVVEASTPPCKECSVYSTVLEQTVLTDLSMQRIKDTIWLNVIQLI